MKDIKAIALDVDGVLTDGTFIWGMNSEEYKQFSFADIMGISIALKAGLIFALISGEDNVIIDRYAEKMNIIDIYKGCKDKASAVIFFSKKYDIDLNQICFMGDDVNDISALEIVGFPSAPANAHESVKQKVKFVTLKAGGHGAVRELIDFILAR